MSQIKISQEQANVTLKGTNTNTTTALYYIDKYYQTHAIMIINREWWKGYNELAIFRMNHYTTWSQFLRW